MTEERLIEIMVSHNGLATTKQIEAMKQAVNEAIQECAETAEAKQIQTALGFVWEVDTYELLNLKVK